MSASITQFFSHLPCWTSDAVLLQRYVHERDEAAFAALVARHGNWVLRLCRRILGDAHAAEDAFQATFLILAQKAHSLKQPDALPAWLYGVARRVALKARGQSYRRAAAPLDETLLDPRPDPLTQLSVRELLDILDEEVQRLPAAQRSAIVLCCLEGHTQEEAARMLGWTVGSVKGRLERGRQRLQVRLQRRGIALSAALSLVVLMRDRAAARVPALLLQNTLKAALGGGIGSSAAALAQSVLNTMFLGKLAGVIAVVLMAALATSTTVALAYRSPEAKPPEDKAPAAPVPPKAPQARGPAAGVDRFGDPLPDGALLRLGTIRYRVGQGIDHAALSPDGKLLATACEFGITFFDLATGKPRHLRDSGVANAFADNGSKVAFSPDGKQLVNVTHGGNLRFWDVATGKRLRVVGDGVEPPATPRGGVDSSVIFPPVVGDTRFTKVWFPPQSQTVIATSNQTHFAVFVEPSTGKILRRFRTAGELASVAADGKTLVSIGGHQAILYDDRGTELRRFPHEGKMDIATLCQGGKQLVTVNEKSEIKIWDAATGKEQRTIAAPAVQRPAVVSIAPDENTLFVGTWEGDILRWDLRDGKRQSPLRGHLWLVTGLFPMPDGRSLVSVGWDNTVRRWDLATGKEEPSGEGYSRYVVVARSPEGRIIAMASYPGHLEFWDARTGKRLRSFSLPVKWFSRLRFSPDGKQLALGCSDAKVRLWNVDKERVTREWQLPPQKQPGLDGDSGFEGLAWSPDGRYLTTSIAHTDGLWMWEAATGKEIWHEARQGVIAFAPDGRTLVSGGWDKCLTFQDAATGKLRFTLKEDRNIIDGIAFSPDGASLATCHHGGNVYLRDPKSGAVCKTLRAHQGEAWSISFSPDGRWLASSGNDAVCVWEVATGAEVLCRKGHEGRIYQVEFGAEGRTVLSSSLDLTALLWDVRPSIDPGRKRSLEMLWADLASEDAPRAYQAIHQLAAAPNTAIPLLRKHLRPNPAMDTKRIAHLIADLDSDDFATRQKATAELEKLGEQALPAYRKALDGKPSLETRRRLEELQTKAQAAWWDVSGDRLRSLRAIEVLKLAGNKEAREVLETLAAGAEGARLTQDAKAALARLANGRR